MQFTFYEWSFRKIVMSQDSYFHSIPWNFMSIENSCPHNEQGSFLFPAIKWILCSRLSCLGKPKLLYRSPIMSNFWRQFFQVTLIGCVQSCNSKTIDADETKLFVCKIIFALLIKRAQSMTFLKRLWTDPFIFMALGFTCSFTSHAILHFFLTDCRKLNKFWLSNCFNETGLN